MMLGFDYLLCQPDQCRARRPTVCPTAPVQASVIWSLSGFRILVPHGLLNRRSLSRAILPQSPRSPQRPDRISPCRAWRLRASTTLMFLSPCSCPDTPAFRQEHGDKKMAESEAAMPHRMRFGQHARSAFGPVPVGNRSRGSLTYVEHAREPAPHLLPPGILPATRDGSSGFCR
jgi:hypothetical protein